MWTSERKAGLGLERFQQPPRAAIVLQFGFLHAGEDPLAGFGREGVHAAHVPRREIEFLDGLSGLPGPDASLGANDATEDGSFTVLGDYRHTEGFLPRS